MLLCYNEMQELACKLFWISRYLNILSLIETQRKSTAGERSKNETYIYGKYRLYNGYV